MSKNKTSMTGKICIITGATSGIGAATAMALAHQGATTIIVGRDKKKCKRIIKRIKSATGNSSIVFMLADLSSQEETRKLAKQFKTQYPRLDVLINNAGAKYVNRQETVDGLEMTFAFNHLAYFLLTNLLLDHLKQSEEGRIVNVSSGAHGSCSINFEDPLNKEKYVGKQVYNQSKLANILFTYELARHLEGTRITVNALEPGGVATNFCRNNGLVSWLKHLTAHALDRDLIGPIEGAKTSIYLATSPEVKGISGKYFSKKKPIRSSDASYNQETAKRLWHLSLGLTGLSPAITDQPQLQDSKH